MTEKTLGQLLVVGIPGPRLTPEIATQFSKLQPGGFILFGRNLKSPQQVRQLLDDLRDVCEIEPLIMLDQEGGRVSRLRLIGSEPPSAQQLRLHGNLRLIKKHGKLTGKLLRLFGFNLDIAPVLDISHNGDETNSLKGRCFGLTPEEVIRNAGAFTTGLRSERILACGKHFPGYSAAEVDPHEGMSIIQKSLQEMQEWELKPFRELLPQMDSLMPAHTHYPCWDAKYPRWPASLSHNIIDRLLRQEWGFDRLLITDDLDMGALINEVPFADTVRHAILAGNDMALICHRIHKAEEAVSIFKSLPESLLANALQRIETAKRALPRPSKFSIETFQEIDAKIWQLRVDVLGEDRARILSVEDGKRSPVETY